MKKLIILLLLLPAVSYGQSISISPYSAKIWGQTDGTARVAAEYKDIKVVGLYAGKRLHHHIDGEYRGTYDGSFIGIFYTPRLVEWKGFAVDFGPGLWNRKFPTAEGEYLHFSLSASYQITDMIALTYSHMSNGLSIPNKLNPGLDNIGVTINFN